MDKSRILKLSDKTINGNAVVYAMGRDQRMNDNYALLAAQEEALKQKVPLYVFMVLVTPQGFRVREQFEFMIDGLEQLASSLKAKNINFIYRAGDPVKEITGFLDEVSASHVYFDFSPLKMLRDNAKTIAKAFKGTSYVVDTHNVIPVWVTSDKQETAAHTIRRKVHQHLADYLIDPPKIKEHPILPKKVPKSISFSEARNIIKAVDSNGIKLDFSSGEQAASKQLSNFISERLETYAAGRNNIAEDGQSGLSPYLHFGQISSLRVALDVIHFTKSEPLLFKEPKMANDEGPDKLANGMNVLLEEMIVRKELSDNFCFYNGNYMSIKGAPNWAQESLSKHTKDKREFIYTKKEWEQAKTHDEAWNAAQNQLAKSGKLHGYMRMYWAKKILEWSKDPEDALLTAIYLNDAYSIDGGDPNGYVGILWSIAGLHDRPWFERPVYGTIRYMNASGLSRKFDLKSYIEQWQD